MGVRRPAGDSGRKPVADPLWNGALQHQHRIERRQAGCHRARDAPRQACCWAHLHPADRPAPAGGRKVRPRGPSHRGAVAPPPPQTGRRPHSNQRPAATGPDCRPASTDSTPRRGSRQRGGGGVISPGYPPSSRARPSRAPLPEILQRPVRGHWRVIRAADPPAPLHRPEPQVRAQPQGLQTIEPPAPRFPEHADQGATPDRPTG